MHAVTQLRLEEYAREWRLRVDAVRTTTTAVVAYGHREGHPVVLKIAAPGSDEWSAGKVLVAFGGRGVVRVLEHGDGAVLLERLMPGTSLADAELDDDEATAVLAGVIGRMSPDPPPNGTPTVESWGQGFERYASTGARAIPPPLVAVADRTYQLLCASQASTRLLHGDLHHRNVLLDSRRGWLAIDPKGVVGELACETGAALRNPRGRPDLFASTVTIRKRVDCFARMLSLDPDRVLAWAFAQSVLAAIWELEDDGALNAGRGWIAFADAVRPMLGDSESGAHL
jgi:streptomycin 6-kinase